MTVSVVNGYVCETSCEAATAKKGEDPHALRRALLRGDGETSASGPSAADRPAVIFGGSLTDFLTATAVTPSGEASPVSSVTARRRATRSISWFDLAGSSLCACRPALGRPGGKRPL